MSADGSVQVGAEQRPGSTINEDSIRRLVHGFCAAVRDDDVIGPVFGREIATAVIGLAERIAHSFRLAIAFHRGEDSVGIQPLPAQ